jgi:hypothetical protein
MGRLLGWANLLVGGLLLFALSDIVNLQWFASPMSRLIAFILAALLSSNGVILAVQNEENWERHYSRS